MMTFGNHRNRVFTALLGVVLAGVVTSCIGAISNGSIVYHRTGGFTGLDDRLTIDANLKATVVRKTGRQEFVLEQGIGNRLEQQLNQAQFTQLKKEYMPPTTCCDLFEYTITYMGHTVRTMDTAVPESLQPVLDTLNEIIETSRTP